MTASRPARLDLADVQGLVRSSYGTLACARYLGYTFGDGDGASFLTSVLPLVTTAAEQGVVRGLHVALSATGLAALGVDAAALRLFPLEFADGMATAARSRFLGDVGDSAPDSWVWGGPGNPRVDVLVFCFAADDSALGGLVSEVDDKARAAGADSAATLPTRALETNEPFGFRDGVSQPLVVELTSTPTRSGERAVPVGEFLLGYPNAYGNLTDRPVLPAAADPDHLLPVTPAGADLGRNGTYVVVRSLQQDVAAFNDYVDRAAREQGVTPEYLSARLVGRWKGGAPLATSPESDTAELATANGFGYHNEDPHGYACPLGAHIRRANPRDHLDGLEQDVAITNRHRLLRRGRAYGPDDLSGPVGLHFIAVNASLSRQFEFVQHTWLNNPKFNGLYNDVDPVAGARTPDARQFTAQARPVRIRYPDPPSFVTTVGGGYFFLPSMNALRFLAA